MQKYFTFEGYHIFGRIKRAEKQGGNSAETVTSHKKNDLDIAYYNE